MKLKTKIGLGALVISSVALISSGAIVLALYPFNRDNKYATAGITEIKPISANVEQANGLVITESQLANTSPAYLLQIAPSEVEKSQDARLSTLKSPMQILEDKIVSRLGFGPEIAMLNEIHLAGTVNAANADTLGFYVGQTYQLFINMETVYDRLVKWGYLAQTTSGALRTYQLVKLVSNNIQNLYEVYSVYYDVLTEIIFQVIYHEYGHHIANVYLNSDNSYDNNVSDPSSIPKTVYRKDKAGAPSLNNPEAWDSDFYNTFVNTLGYDDAYVRQLSASERATAGYYLSSMFNPASNTYTNRTSFPTNNLTILPLSNLYSPKQLFDMANLIQRDANGNIITLSNGLYAELIRAKANNISYAAFGANSTWSHNPLDTETLLYTYSLAELFTRKMMQATMPHPTPVANSTFNYGYTNLSTVVSPVGRQTYASDFLSDTLSYSNGARVPYNANAITPIPTQAQLIAQSADQPFYYDFLFAGRVKGATTATRTYQYDNSHAQAIYQALINRMGYASGDDISHLWWQYVDADGNKVGVTQNSLDGSLSAKQPVITTQIKFGGYLSEADLGPNWANNQYYINYTNGNNQNVNLPISIYKFNYHVKPYLMAQAGTVDPTITDQYFYVLNDYVSANVDLFNTGQRPASIINSVANKKLYLVRGTGNNAPDLATRQILRSINAKASTDAGSWINSNSANFTSTFIATAEPRSDSVDGTYATIQLHAKAGPNGRT